MDIIKDNYALYNGDCVKVMEQFPKESIDFSIYSPPFCGLYNYSSSDLDMSNCDSYESFFHHYRYCVEQIYRLLKPGRLCAVHCCDIPIPGQKKGYYDLPGKIISLHNDIGFNFFGRIAIWKEPLRVAIRTRLRHLTHKQVTSDSSQSTVASGDFLLIMKKPGDTEVPVIHPTGFMNYAGETVIPEDILKYRGRKTQQRNKFSQWIWRRYASCFWDDVRIDNVLPYKSAKEPDDEKHVHPLQLDVIERALMLWTNPDEIVLSPFDGVGSEVCGSLLCGRKGIGIELKSSYHKQALKNAKNIEYGKRLKYERRGLVR